MYEDVRVYTVPHGERLAVCMTNNKVRYRLAVVLLAREMHNGQRHLLRKSKGERKGERETERERERESERERERESE